MAQCDFCGEADPTWEIPAIDTYLGTIEAFDAKHVHTERHYSLGAWASCDTCVELVRQNDRDGLRNRCLEILIERYPGISSVILAEAVSQVQEKFWAAKVGDPVLISTQGQ